MNGLRTLAPSLGLWWRSGTALSAALAVDADVTENAPWHSSRLPSVAALIVYAGTAIAGHRSAADASAGAP
jgi:hypothetical protein